MASVFTPDILQSILYSVNTEVINRRKPIALDRKAMPWMSVLQKRKGTTGLAGANGPIVKWKVIGGLDLQGWERKDQLTFAESNIELQGQFPYSNIHMGLELVHDDLEAMGYVVSRTSRAVATSRSRSPRMRRTDWSTSCTRRSKTSTTAST